MASSSSKPAVRLGGVVKKIESPLAKYNSAGQLTCVICNVVVKTEMVWTAHVNGRQHREQVLALKKPKSEPQFAKPQVTLAIKRKADPTSGCEASANGSTPSPSKKGVPADFFDTPKSFVASNAAQAKPIKSILKNSSSKPSPMAPPPPVVRKVEETQHQLDQEMEMEDDQQSKTIENTGTIPEGFFDDPKLDAKV